MQSAVIGLANTTFTLLFDDPRLHAGFCRVFSRQLAISPCGKREAFLGNHALELNDSRPEKTVLLKVLGTGPYEVRSSVESLGKNLTSGEAAWLISCIFGNHIRSNISETICTLHCSSVEIRDRAITLVGGSGRGKSTLSLQLSKYANYIGDEYGYLDLTTGEVWHEPYPVQIKESGLALFPEIDTNDGLLLESELFSKSYFVHHIRRQMSGKRFLLKTIIFPEYSPKADRTALEQISVEHYCKRLLESMANSNEPSVLFRDFLHMAAKNDISFYTITFSNSIDAAVQIVKQFNV